MNYDRKAERMETGGRYFAKESREISEESIARGYVIGACLGVLVAFGPMLGRDIYQCARKDKPVAARGARR